MGANLKVGKTIKALANLTTPPAPPAPFTPWGVARRRTPALPPAYPPPSQFCPLRAGALDARACEKYCFSLVGSPVFGTSVILFCAHFVDKKCLLTDFLFHFFTPEITPHPFRNAL